MARAAGNQNRDLLDPPRAPGELGRLAHYRVRRCIGEGGMGLVFEAEDPDLLRPVALKVIRPELAGSAQIAQRFALEARAMAALKHDHVVTIYQVGQHRGVPFLAMEYLQGMSLSRWLERRHRPSVDLILRLGREMAAGLAAAHDRGLIHRDIKPANIWLEAPIGRVKILDFGLARTESHDVQITHPGMTVGSPAYMAPEQARGEGGGASCDLFSLGCVLYLLSTGRLPFPGATIMAVLTSLSTETPAPPHDLNPAIPPLLDDLILRLLAKKPADRPVSAQAVVKTIRSIERGLLVERQRAELLATTPVPAVVKPTSRIPAPTQEEPKSPGIVDRTRAPRRAAWFAAGAVVLGMALVATSVATGVVLRSRGAGTIVLVRSARVEGAAGASARPLPGPVAAIAANAQGTEPRPAPNPPAPVARPSPADPTDMAQGQRDEAAHDPASDRDRPRPEPPERRRVPDPLVRAEKLAEGSPVIDPDGDCQVLLDRAQNRASIFVPGTAHLLSAELGRMNAPRILQEIRGDWEVRVKATGTNHPGGRASTTRYPPYHGAGILLWQDPANYIRLEIAADLRKGRVFPYANFELRQGGSLTISRGLRIEDGSSYLRLRRRGEEIHGAFSPDGVHWTPFAPIVASLNERLEVGIVAVNSASKPLKAELEGFVIMGDSGSGAEREGDVGTDGPERPKRPPPEAAPAPPGSSTAGRPSHHRAEFDGSERRRG